MKKLLLVAALALPGLANAAPLTGQYQTAPGTTGGFLHVEMGPCSDNPALTCGTILRAFSADGSPDPAYEHLGKPIVWNMADKGNDHWSGGKIWAPDDDKTYNSKMSLNGDVLKVSGCVLIFCRDMNWQKLP